MDKKVSIIVAIAVVAVVAIAAVMVLSSPQDHKEGVTDYAGNVIELKEEPKRIVSTSAVSSEMLCNLGYRDAIVGVASGSYVYDVVDYVVGLTFDLHYPEGLPADIDSGKIANIGSYNGWTAEGASAAHPDIVIVEKAQVEDTNKVKMTSLQALGIVVIVINSEYGFQDCLDNYTMLGKIFGKQSLAKTITDQMQNAYNKVKDVAAKSDLNGKKFAYICTCPPWGNYIYKNALIISLLNDVGFVNALPVTEGSYRTIQLQETVAQANPDFIIFDDMGQHLNWTEVIAGWKADPVLGAVDCIKNDMFWCMEYEPFQAIGYNSAHLINGAALIGAIVNPEETGVDVPTIVTSEKWTDYIQWLKKA